jgi:UDP-glucose 4-epimerase
VELNAAGHTSIILDNFRNSHPVMLENIRRITGEKLKFHKVDCARDGLEKVFEEESPVDAVVHFAALKAVGESYVEPVEYYENNLGSTIRVLRYMKKFGVRKLIFSSSATVYGEPDTIPVTEESPLRVTPSPYGKTKQMCEAMIADFMHANPDYACVTLRYFNPIGAHESALIGELPIGTPNNLVPIITQSAAGRRGPVTVFGKDYPTPDGTCIRDYVHVADLASAHVRALELLGQNGGSSVFNIGTGRGHSVLEVIRIFEEVSGLKLNYTIGARREGDIPQIWADNRKAINELGWRPKHAFEQAIADAWRWEKFLETAHF